jgi:RNA recognition motif-containing protein
VANKIYVANLGYEVTASQIHDLFSQAGEVVDIELAMDQDTRQSRGYAFIHMSTADGAMEAVRQFNKQLMGSRHLIVSEAIRQD